MRRRHVRALLAAHLLGPIRDEHNTFSLRAEFRRALRAADLLLHEADNDEVPSDDAPPPAA